MNWVRNHFIDSAYGSHWLDEKSELIDFRNDCSLKLYYAKLAEDAVAKSKIKKTKVFRR